MRNWIIVFFVIFAARLSAHDGDSIKITHGPYLCDMSTDGVTVVWTTNKPALSWVEVAPAGEDHFYGKERPRYYDTESGRKRANDTIHRVRIKHLEPGREYRYRIFSREVVSWPSSNLWIDCCFKCIQARTFQIQNFRRPEERNFLSGIK